MDTEQMNQAGIPAKARRAAGKVVETTVKEIEAERTLRRAQAEYNRIAGANERAQIALQRKMEAGGLDQETQKAVQDKLKKAAAREDREARARARDRRNGLNWEAPQDPAVPVRHGWEIRWQ